MTQAQLPLIPQASQQQPPEVARAPVEPSAPQTTPKLRARHQSRPALAWPHKAARRRAIHSQGRTSAGQKPGKQACFGRHLVVSKVLAPLQAPQVPQAPQMPQGPHVPPHQLQGPQGPRVLHKPRLLEGPLGPPRRWAPHAVLGRTKLQVSRRLHGP